MVAAQRSRFVSALLLSAAAYVFVSRAFVGVAPAAPSMRGSVAMKNFKEEFDAWRGSLSKEEKGLVAEQAEKVFDKKFLKTERAKETLPQEKMEAFAKVLGKFFDNEDYKKDQKARMPDYSSLSGKVQEQNDRDFPLKFSCVAIDRMADRRYNYASKRIREAQAKGEFHPLCTPRQERWAVGGDSPEAKKSHEEVMKMLKELKKENPELESKMKESKNPEAKKSSLEEIEAGHIWLYADALQLVQQTVMATKLEVEQFEKGFPAMMEQNETLKKMAEGKSMDELKETFARNLRDASVEPMMKEIEGWWEAKEAIEEEALMERDIFRTQRDNSDGKITKADVLKEIWTEIPKQLNVDPLPPIDEELLAELSTQPAGDGFVHPWGTADKLYKSEAIDSFRQKYLLGVFETKEEARAAFDDWNKEYKEARVAMKDEFEAFGKRENARVEQDASARDRILAVLEETRSKLNR